MATYLLKNEEDITDNHLFYIENESHSLFSMSEIDIQNYMDREIDNPELIKFLDEENITSILDSEPEPDQDDLILNSIQKNRIKNLIRKIKFKKLKNKIKKIICKAIQGIDGLEPKEIIGSILVALIPAFGAGIPAILLPFIIGFVALILKYGIEYVCPV